MLFVLKDSESNWKIICENLWDLVWRLSKVHHNKTETTCAKYCMCLWKLKFSACGNIVIPIKSQKFFSKKSQIMICQTCIKTEMRSYLHRMYINISSVVEFKRWRVLKSKIFAMWWPGFKDFIWFSEMEELTKMSF